LLGWACRSSGSIRRLPHLCKYVYNVNKEGQPKLGPLSKAEGDFELTFQHLYSHARISFIGSWHMFLPAEERAVPKTLEELSALEARTQAPATLVVSGDSIHYLQLWPTRKFSYTGGSTSSAWVLTHYGGLVRAFVQNLQARRPRAIIAWRTSNRICSSRYVDSYLKYAMILRDAPLASPHADLVAKCNNYVAQMRNESSDIWERKERQRRQQAPLGVTIEDDGVQLDCFNTQLSESGAEWLATRSRQALRPEQKHWPLHNESRGGGLLIHDAQKLTYGECKITDFGDGRHFIPLALWELWLILKKAKGMMQHRLR
jgi:hypothetical protein